VGIFNSVGRWTMRRYIASATQGMMILLLGTCFSNANAQTMRSLRGDSGADVACRDFTVGRLGVPTSYGVVYQGGLRIRRCARYSLVLLELPGMHWRLANDVYAQLTLATCGKASGKSYRFQRISPNRPHAMLRITTPEDAQLDQGNKISLTISNKSDFSEGLCSTATIAPASLRAR